MPKAIVTGSGGLIGSESAARLVESGYDVIGIENDTRAVLFGPEASTSHVTERLKRELAEFRNVELDIRDADGISRVFAESGKRRSSSWSTPRRSHPTTGPRATRRPTFGINANGTLNLLEATRQHCPDATFVFTSTNKVYGDTPNRLPLEELDTRLELPEDHPYVPGIDTTMSIDSTLHSLFGASKAAADLLVQEYGRYFEMPTVCFRGGCLTGPNHAGAQLHGFLAYLMKCTVTGDPYTVFGYDGKQVRDNVHSADLVDAFLLFHENPQAAAVYNIGGGRENACSMLEAIEICERVAGRELELGDERPGAHRRPSLVDQRPRRVRLASTAAGDRSGTWRRSCARSTKQTPNAGPLRRHEALRRHPGPQRGGDGPRDRRGTRRDTLQCEQIEHEVIVVDDSSTDGTAAVVAADRDRAPSGSLLALALPQRLRLRRAGRSRGVRGRRGGDRDGRRLRQSRRIWSLISDCSRRATSAPSARASSTARTSSTTRARS